MMTRDLLVREMARSEASEERTYKELTLSLFRDLQAPLKALYEEMASATSQLTTISRTFRGKRSRPPLRRFVPLRSMPAKRKKPTDRRNQWRGSDPTLDHLSGGRPRQTPYRP